MKIAAIVVTYHPDTQLFLNNLDVYQEAVDKILIWRNSKEEVKLPKHLLSKIEFCGNGTNEYMAKPLNYAIGWCLKNQYDYLLTMDQDSTWKNCNDFISYVKKNHQGHVAIYAPNVNEQHQIHETEINVESVITSGSLCNVKIAHKLGGFREDYQIYWVDCEYCYWVCKNGYEIKILPHCHLLQRFGKETKTIFGYTAANYAPIIYYFMFRNILKMKKEYRNHPSWRCILYTTFYYIRGILLGENHKLKKLFMIGKGYWNGIFQPIKNKRNL